MRFKIREKIFSFGDNFTIRDEYDQDKYYIKGKVLSLGDKLRLYSINDEELIYIEQKLFKFLPEFNLYSGGKNIAKVKKEFTFFKPRFNIESDLGSYRVEGDFLSHEFTIIKNDSVVVNVSKRWFSFSDTYGVEIDDSENQAFMLALVIVIDQVLHDDKNGHN